MLEIKLGVDGPSVELFGVWDGNRLLADNMSYADAELFMKAKEWEAYWATRGLDIKTVVNDHGPPPDAAEAKSDREAAFEKSIADDVAEYRRVRGIRGDGTKDPQPDVVIRAGVGGRASAILIDEFS